MGLWLRRALIAGSLAVGTAVAVLIAASALLCEGALRVPASLRAPVSDRLADEFAARTGARWSAAEIRSYDGVPLRGWLFLPPHPNTSAVILLHGVADTRKGVLGHAAYLLGAGYTVLTPDSRAHGESGGDLMTFGVRERSDVALWAKWMRSAGYTRLYGLGESMGAAILLQAADEFEAVVAECSFATFRRIAEYRVGERTGAWKWLRVPVVEAGFLYARIRHGIDLGMASPADCLKNSAARVLLIHGTADRNIPPEHALQLARANPKAAVWLVPEAGHTGALASQPVETERRVLRCFAGVQM